MRNRSAITTTDVAIGVLILLAVIIGTIAVRRLDTFGDRGQQPPAGDDRSDQLPKIDPALIHYQETTAAVAVDMEQVRALAVGPDDSIYVAGDRAIHAFGPDGTKHSEIALSHEPKCLAAGDTEHAYPGRLYVGMADHVETFDVDGKPVAAWPAAGGKALLTSIAVAERDVFVADAGNKIVWHYDESGKLKGRIGDPDQKRKVPGFVITTPYFDLAVSPDGLVRVVNPRALRIEAYTFGGDFESAWGKAGAQVEGFYGCCNPAHFTMLPDGRFVTAEKGTARVKVYNGRGEFECVVAGPEQVSAVAADVAADGRGRILILDPVSRSVRIFTRKEPEKG